jgi:hypothetical protein
MPAGAWALVGFCFRRDVVCTLEKTEMFALRMKFRADPLPGKIQAPVDRRARAPMIPQTARDLLRVLFD